MTRVREAARAVRHAGLRRRCPVCGARLRHFVAEPASGRPGARCPRCGALERHRHLWLFLERHGRPSGRLLHLAPEPALERRLRALPGVDYLSGDLAPGAAMAQLDLERLDLPDASFDWILCLHVLEHVADDRAAMGELLRVLRPGGTAIVQVPVIGERTVEDPSVTDPAERRARFGQADHVRIYGRDVYDRLRAAGFAVELHVFRDELPTAQRARFGLDWPGAPVDMDALDDPWTIALCRRPG